MSPLGFVLRTPDGFVQPDTVVVCLCAGETPCRRRDPPRSPEHSCRDEASSFGFLLVQSSLSATSPDELLP